MSLEVHVASSTLNISSNFSFLELCVSVYFVVHTRNWIFCCGWGRQLFLILNANLNTYTHPLRRLHVLFSCISGFCRSTGGRDCHRGGGTAVHPELLVPLHRVRGLQRAVQREVGAIHARCKTPQHRFGQLLAIMLRCRFSFPAKVLSSSTTYFKSSVLLWYSLRVRHANLLFVCACVFVGFI